MAPSWPAHQRSGKGARGSGARGKGRWSVWIALGCVASAAWLPAQSTTSTTPAKKPADIKKSGGLKKTADIKKPGDSESTAKSKTKPPAKQLPGITPAREAAVMTFVKHHHAELSELLVHLKENAPKEYDRAVRDLFRTSERLAQLQERDSQAYELELRLWKARSRAQLLAARLQMTSTEELRAQLRTALREEAEIRLALLERDRQRTADRLEKLQEQIAKLKDRGDDEIEKQMRQLTAPARDGESKAKSTSKKKS